MTERLDWDVTFLCSLLGDQGRHWSCPLSPRPPRSNAPSPDAPMCRSDRHAVCRGEGPSLHHSCLTCKIKGRHEGSSYSATMLTPSTCFLVFQVSPKNRTAGSCGNSTFKDLRICPTVFDSSCTIYISTSNL